MNAPTVISTTALSFRALPFSPGGGVYRIP
jgi:hypothetical protein